MGKYHPHGDTSLLRRDGAHGAGRSRCASRWSTGTATSARSTATRAAAYRYTEARLAPLAMELLDEIEQGTVDFRPNYDGTTEEPIVLPARFPHLLVNGCTGIAVGMATNIPPHNLGEVSRRAVAMIDDRKLRDQGPAEVHQGSRLPDRRPDHQQQEGAARDLRGRAGRGQGARRVEDGGGRARRRPHRRHVDSLTRCSKSSLVEQIAEVIIAKKLPRWSTCATSRPTTCASCSS